MEFIGLAQCGGVNDTSQTNAVGSCQKVVENAGILYTSTPSIAALTQLGYVKADGDEIGNDGRTYKETYSGSASNGIAGTFGRFDSVSNGEGMQMDRWCAALSDIGFGGRDNWHIPTSPEFKRLVSATPGGLQEAYGWPANYRVGGGYQWGNLYATNTLDLGGRWLTVALVDGIARPEPQTQFGRYVSCASDAP